MGRCERAVMLGPADGEQFEIIGGGVRVLLDGKASGGQCCVLEIPVTPGDGPPLHTHEREDELFYILEGRVKFALNGETFVAERGAFVCAPRGSVHTFKNIGATEARMIVTCTPAGIEHVFRAIAKPRPGSAGTGQTQEQVVAALGAHGITFKGPPLA